MAHAHAEHRHPYARLLVMTALSYAAMYVLMYSMVNAMDSVYLNINNAYMAGLMAAPMLVIELALMRAMYPKRALNAALIVAGAVVLAVLWAFTREQTAVTDRQFLRSMIPHHSGAILMCREASIRDAEIRALCGQIVDSQQREIDQMRRILDRLRPAT